MLKNVHLIINLEKLKQDINCKDHSKNIWNMRQRYTKEFLYMFFVELKPVTNNKDIYNI